MLTSRAALLLLAAVACDSGALPPPPPRLDDGECFIDADCATEQLCYDVECLRRPACRNPADAAACPTDCVGVCADPDLVQYCTTDEDCDAFDPSMNCRIDARFCVRDRRNDSGDCVGWCTGFCAPGVLDIASPETGLCFAFPDSCTPPGFPILTDAENCVAF